MSAPEQVDGLYLLRFSVEEKRSHKKRAETVSAILECGEEATVKENIDHS